MPFIEHDGAVDRQITSLNADQASGRVLLKRVGQAQGQVVRTSTSPSSPTTCKPGLGIQLFVEKRWLALQVALGLMINSSTTSRVRLHTLESLENLELVAPPYACHPFHAL